MINKLAIITSGGDVPGLNACIRAVVRAATFNNIPVCGVQHGYDGLIRGELIELSAASVGNIIQLGGTMLKSARSKKFESAEGRREARRQLDDNGVDAVVLIGGDGSIAGASVFAREHTDVSWIAIPKTIDNDVHGTDLCIGYDTALNTAVYAIDKLRDTAESHERIFVVEVMGRDAGYIAYGAGIGSGAESILIPETKADYAYLEQVLADGWSREKRSVIVVVAEGDESGGGAEVIKKLKKRFPDREVRLSVLGHIQRGGSPTCADRILASRLGVAAVDALLAGKRNALVGIVNNDIHFTPFDKVSKRRLQVNDDVLKLLKTLAS